MTAKAPVFIVGAPRSGTTLLSAMFAAHSMMSCGPETHFFGNLSRVNPDTLCDPNTWPDVAVNFICNITNQDFFGNQDKLLIEKYNIPKKNIQNYLANKSPSISNILSSVTEQYMSSAGKTRWVEKTPNHIFHLKVIRRYFPESPIIQIIRDPRDVALSLLKMPWGANTFLEAIFYWDRLIKSSEYFFSTDDLAYTLRYEDLILSPQEELLKLCQFIDMEFEDRMLDTSNSSKHINSRNLAWKTKASQPIDTSRVYAWQKELSKSQNQLTEAILGDRLNTYNYPLRERFIGLGEVYPSINTATSDERTIEIVISQRIRFWKIEPGEKPIVKLFIGNPGSEDWLGNGKTSRISRVISIIVVIVRARVLNQRIYWITEIDDRKRGGYLAFLLQLFLRPFQISQA